MLETIAANRFRILRKLGEGGMGEVYEAIDSERRERVAMKVLRGTSADAIVRFKREFRALQDLHHPNLVTLGELVSEGSCVVLLDGARERLRLRVVGARRPASCR